MGRGPVVGLISLFLGPQKVIIDEFFCGKLNRLDIVLLWAL